MKAIQVLTVCVLIVLAGLPIPALAQSVPEVFALPAGVAGGSYQATIQAILREKYQLKLETDVSASVFRWSFAGGEMPPGLVVRPSGTIVGSPRVSRDEPYLFQVRVVDLAYAGSEALKVNLSLTIAARRIRLTQVRTPRLTPVNPVATETHHQTSDVQVRHDVETVRTDTGRAAVQSAFLKTVTSPIASPVDVRGETELTAPLNRPAVSSSNAPIVDTSYDPNLIRPLLRTLKASPPLPLPARLSNRKEYEVDVSKEIASADKIRGPADITLKNMNVLRYDNRVGKEVRFPPAPDLTLPFIPPIPGQPERQTPGGQGLVAGFAVNPPTCPTVNDCFSEFVDRLNVIERDKTSTVNNVIVNVSQKVNHAAANLLALVSASDSILNSGGGAQAIIDGLTPLIGTTAAPGGSVDSALAANVIWPDTAIENLLGDLNVLENDVLRLPTLPIGGGPTFHNWYQVATNKAAYDGLRARIDELQTQLNGLKSSSPQGIAFQTAQSKLRLWKPILVGVQNGDVKGFNREFEVGCGFAFDTGKETKVKLIKRDRLADPGTAPTEEEIVTVVCSSPLSVSAGFGFSHIDESEFVFVPSTKTVTENGQTTQTVISRFGFRNKSAFRTLPVVLLNTRVWEPNDIFAVHASTGAAVDIKTGQGGTDLEYIVGPSFSFWRSLFVTPGLHIGRVNKLAGGFEPGQEVPTGISEPPIEKSWKKAFVTTFTYKIR